MAAQCLHLIHQDPQPGTRTVNGNLGASSHWESLSIGILFPLGASFHWEPLPIENLFSMGASFHWESLSTGNLFPLEPLPIGNLFPLGSSFHWKPLPLPRQALPPPSSRLTHGLWSGRAAQGSHSILTSNQLINHLPLHLWAFTLALGEFPAVPQPCQVPRKRKSFLLCKLRTNKAGASCPPAHTCQP